MEIVLRDFYNFFAGQRVNVEQSQLAFSANVKPEVSNWLLSQFAIIVAQNFGVYLEMPLLHYRVGKGTYHFLVEKMRKKHSAQIGKHGKNQAREYLEAKKFKNKQDICREHKGTLKNQNEN